MQHVNTQISPELAYGKKKKEKEEDGEEQIKKSGNKSAER